MVAVGAEELEGGNSGRWVLEFLRVSASLCNTRVPHSWSCTVLRLQVITTQACSRSNACLATPSNRRPQADRGCSLCCDFWGLSCRKPLVDANMSRGRRARQDFCMGRADIEILFETLGSHYFIGVLQAPHSRETSPGGHPTPGVQASPWY